MDTIAPIVADVFGLTCREYAALRCTAYRWGVLAPEAIDILRRARDEVWSMEKLAEHLNAPVTEARDRYRRFLMSEKVNAGGATPDRIHVLFREWLEPFESNERKRREFANDLARLLSSQLHAAAEAGETLADVIDSLENSGGGGPVSGRPSAGDPDAGDRLAWGPQWKD